MDDDNPGVTGAVDWPDEQARIIEGLCNALLWIRYRANLHYMGQAFDPEHMRDLADLASRALNGEQMPDYEAAVTEARANAEKWAEQMRELAE